MIVLSSSPRAAAPGHLTRARVKAVFFVCGWRLESSEQPLRNRARQILRDIVAAGHIVGNHTVHHYQLPTLTPERVRYEIEHNADLIEEVIGERPHLFRPPYGAYSEDVRAPLVSKGNHAGGTVLLHDTHPWSVAAMAKIIRWLDRENSDREQSGRAPYVVLDPARYLEGARARLPQIQAADALVNSSNRGRSRDAGADAGPAVEPTTGVVGEGPVDAGAVTAAMDASDGR